MRRSHESRVAGSPRIAGAAPCLPRSPSGAADPDRARWNQASVSSGQLASVYGFTDIDGSRPDIWRYNDMRERGFAADLDDFR